MQQTAFRHVCIFADTAQRLTHRKIRSTCCCSTYFPQCLLWTPNMAGWLLEAKVEYRTGFSSEGSVKSVMSPSWCYSFLKKSQPLCIKLFPGWLTDLWCKQHLSHLLTQLWGLPARIVSFIYKAQSQYEQYVLSKHEKVAKNSALLFQSSTHMLKHVRL